MRQRETKLNKWEQDLKYRESAMAEQLEEVSSIKRIIVRIEKKIAEQPELEKSNKILGMPQSAANMHWWNLWLCKPIQ